MAATRANKSRRDESPTFDKFAEFIRSWAGLSRKHRIRPETKFEDDLGITGDDGCELLEVIDKEFGVELRSVHDGYQTTFGLEFDEFLFHGEGFSFAPWEFLSLFKGPVPKVRAFTVGELYDAVVAKLAKVSERD